VEVVDVAVFAVAVVVVEVRKCEIQAENKQSHNQVT
jgi:hypothetical protein